jgi:FkbM family methyltransferase
VTEFRLKLKALGQIWRHFENPLLVSMLRFGIVRLPFFAYRLRTTDGKRVTMLARPGTMSLADLFVLREVFVEETYKDILPLLPARPLSVLDVGANLGSFCIWLAGRHGIVRGVCFEPDPSSFRLCRFNLAVNNCPQVDAIPKAVGGSERVIEMRVNTSRPGGNSIYSAASGHDEIAQVEVIAFSECFSTTGTDVIDVLKMDCEGAEWEIVDKTPPQVWQRFSLIVAEIHGDSTQQFRPDDFPKMMEARGFETKRWDGGHMGLYIGVRRSTS